MVPGPSPVIPFLLVLTLGLVIHGGSLMNTVALISDAEQATLNFVLVIPLLFLLLVHFLSATIIVPLALVLITFVVRKMLLGPLVLVFIIYFASVFFPSLQTYYTGRGTYHEGETNEYEGGSTLILVIFLVLSSLVYQGDGNKLGLLLVAMLLYFFCNLPQ